MIEILLTVIFLNNQGDLYGSQKLFNDMQSCLAQASVVETIIADRVVLLECRNLAYDPSQKTQI